MADKIMISRVSINIFLTILTLSIFSLAAIAKEEEEAPISRETFLTNLNSFILTKEYADDTHKLEELIEEKKPKAIYVEEWIVSESKDKNYLKKLKKLTSKHNLKLFLVTGRNVWFGQRGVDGIINAYNTYETNLDGIVFRIEPNKSNVWKDNSDIQAQILNQMLDAFSAIYKETQKRNKLFIVEVPFWLGEFHGPLKTFTEDICTYSDRIVLLIDDAEKLDKLESKWNDLTCSYSINLGKRATRQTSDEKINELYSKVQEKLIFYSNFNGYIIDTGSILDNKKPEISQGK